MEESKAPPWYLVLDVDGTLVAETGDDTTLPKPRPHLQEFLQFAFKNFEKVAVWSAASPQWINPIVEKVIKPPQPFHFVWVNICVTRQARASRECYGTVDVVKPLRKLTKKFPEYAEHNTLILDDTPSTYKQNYGNAIGISSYTGGEDDTELLKVMEWITQWKEEYHQTGTIRHIHKYARRTFKGKSS